MSILVPPPARSHNKRVLVGACAHAHGIKPTSVLQNSLSPFGPEEGTLALVQRSVNPLGVLVSRRAPREAGRRRSGAGGFSLVPEAVVGPQGCARYCQSPRLPRRPSPHPPASPCRATTWSPRRSPRPSTAASPVMVGRGAFPGFG